MWPFTKHQRASVYLTDTLSGKKELFKSITPGRVLLYSCGPTVYGPQHIGNLRAAVFSDTLARTLVHAGYKVKRVINITDVGHLVGDGDEGEDKMMVGAKRENISPEEIAKKYTEQYLGDIKALGIDTKSIIFPRASAYIHEQIRMIRTLEKNGHTYTLVDGVYFDTATFPEYGKLGKRHIVTQEAGARVEVVAGKKDPKDFVLWRKAKPHDLQKWPSPWGEGNPGWSIECSAMIYALLGKTTDIHTGGEDHVSIHHNNEIAQSEGATSVPLAHYWLHNAFLTIDGEKVSKSLGNIFTLDDITARGFHPLALRYLFLQAHYRSPLSFSFDALQSAQEALSRLWRYARILKKEHKKSKSFSGVNELISALYDDLSTPQALALLWKVLNDTTLSPDEKWTMVENAETVLGLSLSNPPEETPILSLEDLPEAIRSAAQEREEARKNKDFGKSDELRIHIENSGYLVVDGVSGSTYTKKQ